MRVGRLGKLGSWEEEMFECSNVRMRVGGCGLGVAGWELRQEKSMEF